MESREPTHSGGSSAFNLHAIVDFLSLRRAWLVTAYLVILALSLAGFAIWGPAIFPEAINYAVTAPASLDLGWNRAEYWILFSCVVGFFVLQAVFLWGGGRVQLAGTPVRMRKLLLSLLIISGLMVLLTILLLLSFAEMVDRSQSAEIGRRISISPLFTRFGVATLIVSWALWLVVGWLAVRHVDHPTALRRLIAVLLAGSWIEFSIALPIEIATRPRTKECPCESGSWWTLMLCIPVLVWSIGPALYLLYRREQRLAQIDRRHPLKVLLQKSKRATTHQPRPSR